MREPQHLFPGKVYPTGEVLVYVKRDRRQRFFDENNRLITLQMCYLAFRGPDGVTRRAKFGQSLADTIDNGQVAGYVQVPVTPTEDWPTFPILPSPPSQRGGDV